GKTDHDGNFYAEDDKIRGLDLQLEKFVETNPKNPDQNNPANSDVILDLTNAPDKVKNVNLSNEDGDQPKQNLIFDLSPNTKTTEQSEATDNDNANKNPTAIIVDPATGEIREIPLVKETNVHASDPTKPIWKLPLDQLKPGEKVDKVIDKNDNDAVLISNANIPDDQKLEHKIPKINEQLSKNNKDNNIVIDDLPSTVKPGESVIVELEDKTNLDSEGNPTKILIPAKVTEDNQIVLDANDLPRDAELDLKNIYQNKSKSIDTSPNPRANEADKGYKLVDIPNAVDKEDPTKKTTFVPKHLNRIFVVKPLNVFDNDNFNDLKLKIELNDTKNLLDTNSKKPIITIVDENNTPIIFKDDEVNYEFSNGKKYLVINPTEKNKKFALNKNYSISKIEYPEKSFDDLKDKTIGHNQSNVIYDKTLENANDLLEDYSHKISVKNLEIVESNLDENKHVQNKIKLELDTNLTKDQLEKNNLVLAYKNKSNANDVVYNKAKPKITIENGKTYAEFDLDFPQT
ncbi:hypothetical protein, partial [[Mycoplasma] collis]|uniref:hypothetical protein n=1 Tax=[Mycoplasma] collis TaxID=2127 RepID=UPI00051B14E6